jgi:hypothetical protein
VALTALMAGDETASDEFDKWDRYVSLHPEHRRALEDEAAAWEAAERPLLLAAQRVCRTLVPPDVFAKGTSIEALAEAGLPHSVAKRVFLTPAIWLVRAPPAFIARLHVADLRSKYSPNNLDLVELRAVYASMPAAFENDAKGDKAQYLASLRQRLVELGRGDLDAAKKRHGSYFPSGRSGVGAEFEAGPFDADAPLVAVTAHRAPPSGAQTDELAKLQEVLRTNARTTPQRAASLSDAPNGDGALKRQGLVQSRRASFMGDGVKAPRNFTLRRRHSTATNDLAKREAAPARGKDLLADLKRSMAKRRAAGAAKPDPAARAAPVDFLAELKRKAGLRRGAATDDTADARRPSAASRRPAALVRSDDAALQANPAVPAAGGP